MSKRSFGVYCRVVRRALCSSIERTIPCACPGRALNSALFGISDERCEAAQMVKGRGCTATVFQWYVLARTPLSTPTDHDLACTSILWRIDADS